MSSSKRRADYGDDLSWLRPAVPFVIVGILALAAGVGLTWWFFSATSDFAPQGRTLRDLASTALSAGLGIGVVILTFKALRGDHKATASLRPLSNWLLLLALLAVLATGGALMWWLLKIASTAGPDAPVRIDAIRTGLSAAVAAGGASALLLAFRRQRTTEVSTLHGITDADERRVTELYTKAADQLGSDKAPVRLAGLYALERLANNSHGQRQTIVNVICAYLQMPFTPPGDAPAEQFEDDRPMDAEQYRSQLQEYEQRVQEDRVRQTAVQILSRHLQQLNDAEGPRWIVGYIDLSGASLADASLVDVHLAGANLFRAGLMRSTLSGANLVRANLRWANLSGANLVNADLRGAQFEGAILDGVIWEYALWNRFTIWPEESKEYIRAESTETSPGHYRINSMRQAAEPADTANSVQAAGRPG